MWCVGALTEQYRERMYALLGLYARPHSCEEPVVCLDEKSTQLLAHSRAALPMQPGRPLRQDYEYVRRGTCNLFDAHHPGGTPLRSGDPATRQARLRALRPPPARTDLPQRPSRASGDG
jgi:hypothetical protein